MTCIRLYLQLPANLNIKIYSNPDSDIGNASNYYDAYAINPYWILDHTRDNYTKDVVLSQLKLKIDPTDWFSASYQISNNFGIYQERITKQEVDFTPYGIHDYLVQVTTSQVSPLVNHWVQCMIYMHLVMVPAVVITV